ECILCPRSQPVIRDRLAGAGQGEGCPCSRYFCIQHPLIQLVSASLRYRLDHHKQLTGYTLVNSDDLRLLQWLNCRLFASSRSKTAGEECGHVAFAGRLDVMSEKTQHQCQVLPLFLSV